jgi:hypothetical protein
VAKVAHRFGCAKQSKNLERYLLHTYYTAFFGGAILKAPTLKNKKHGCYAKKLEG